MHQTVLRTVEKSVTEIIGKGPVTVKAWSTAKRLLGKIQSMLLLDLLDAGHKAK